MSYEEDIRIEPEPQGAHTPGPWQVTGFDSVRQHGGPIICVPRVQSGKISLAQKAANARLIAASPDLLAACKAILPIALAYADPEQQNQRLSHAIMDLQIAIGKAEGR